MESLLRIAAVLQTKRKAKSCCFTKRRTMGFVRSDLLYFCGIMAAISRGAGKIAIDPQFTTTTVSIMTTSGN
jgi:hypothetical protein